MGNVISESSKEGVKDQNVIMANRLQIFEDSIIFNFSESQYFSC